MIGIRSTTKRLVRKVLDMPRARRIRRFHGIHQGEDAVIIGMGPSLKPDDLQYFKGFRSFACNKIYLGFDTTDWRPDYYSVCDLLVAQNNREEILNADFQGAYSFHSQAVWPLLSNQENATYYTYDKCIAHWNPVAPAALTNDLGKGIHSEGRSVIIDQIQIAALMGFRNIYVVGVDFSFSGGVSTGKRCVSGEILVSEGEVNHFHKNYRKPGETWTVPKMQEQARAFEFCHAACKSAGINLFNASRESALTALPRVAFEDVFKKPARA